MQIILTPWLNKKNGFLYDQSDEIKLFEASLGNNVEPGANFASKGYCLTASLYWIKSLMKRPELARGGDEQLLLKKRDKMIRTHEAASEQNAGLRAEAAAVRTANDEFQERVAALKALKGRIEKVDDYKREKARLTEHGEALKVRSAQFAASVRDARFVIGDASLLKSYRDVALRYGLALADGKKGKFNADGDVGADIARHLAPGKYYLIVFEDSTSAGASKDGHGMAIAVSHRGWFDRAGIADPASPPMPCRMYYFDPNLGNFGCGLEKSGARFLRELFMSYLDHTGLELEFDTWSLFAVTGR